MDHPGELRSWEEEREALAAAGAGNPEMEEYLIKKYQYFVLYKCKPFFLPDGDKEDLIQEGMIGLMEAIRGYSPDKNMSFLAFADLCITRQILSAIQSSGKKNNIPLNRGVSLNEESESDEMLIRRLADETALDPETMIIHGEELQNAMGRIHQSLSVKERKVFFAYLDGYSYKQIADMLETNMKSVDNTMQRVRKKIEELLRSRQTEADSDE